MSREVNPYSPTTTLPLPRRMAKGWIKRFLILNSVLVAIPVLLALLVFLAILVEISRQSSTLNGDPVTHQHDVEYAAPDLWFLALYVLIPNCLLIAWLVGRTWSHRGTSVVAGSSHD